MSGIPQEIPDYGSAQLAPRQNPEFSPGAGFTTEDYFVWSRLDGRTSLRDVILMVGLGTDKAIDVLRRLRRSGAVLLPGETEAPVVSEPQPPAAQPAKAAGGAKPRDLTASERSALDEDVELGEAERLRIIEVMRLVGAGDFFALLGVPRDVEGRALKKSYFRLSKEFHPDRYYQKRLGSFGPWLSRIFEAATEAFEVLGDTKRRAEHLRQLGADHSTVQKVAGSQGKEDHAAELFQRGCDMEIAGDAAGALQLLAAAVRLDRKPAYLRRAARCALAAEKLAEAENFAKEAAGLRSDNPSYVRILADVYRAQGRLEQAEKVLMEALDIPSSSDLLVRELEADLAKVRRARSGV